MADASARPTGWGILATGKIAHSFARDLRAVPGARIAAVGSRRVESAAELAGRHGDADTRAHGSYADLVALYDENLARSRELSAGRDLEEESANPAGDEPVTLRWILLHLIEEYARHNGHADLIRESIDGVVGE